MSFSFEFVARSRAHAVKKLDRTTHIPEPVRDFITRALDNLPYAADTRVIMVKASGHLSTGNDYAVSSLNIEVRPIEATD